MQGQSRRQGGGERQRAARRAREVETRLGRRFGLPMGEEVEQAGDGTGSAALRQGAQSGRDERKLGVFHPRRDEGTT